MTPSTAKVAFVVSIVAEVAAALAFPLTIWHSNPSLHSGETAFGSVLTGLFINGPIVAVTAIAAATLAFRAFAHMHLAARALIATASLALGPLVLMATGAIFIRIMDW